MGTATSLEDFEHEVHTFLDRHATPKPPDVALVWGTGADTVAMFEEKSREREQLDLARAKAWRATRFDAGLGWITGPAAYGGRELGQAHQRAYDALEGRYEVPPQSAFVIGLGMVAPTILAHGSEVVKAAYLAKLYRGDLVACQLFSEPGAGSDLASLQTRAERDGDEWVVNGQKVWTSGAQYADIGEIICRTDLDQPKHRGLTGFVVDMRASGVEVRPLRQMTGGASFNEVFFTDVRVRDDHRLGDVNNGWNVALTTLMNERAAIGAGGGGGGAGGLVERALLTARQLGRSADPLVRQRLADLVINTKVASLNNRRALDKIRAGQAPGPELSIAKLSGTLNMRRLVDAIEAVLGSSAVVDTGEWGTYAWSQLILGAPGGRIAGGSDEVMRNIVAERVLGLPKDPGIDTTTAFRDLPVGTQVASAR